MKSKHEKKIISEYRKICDNPNAQTRVYHRIAVIAFAVAWLCIFACFFGYFQNYEPAIHLVIFGFVGGVTLCLGFWFSQIGPQVKILAQHISKESLEKRINELST